MNTGFTNIKMRDESLHMIRLGIDWTGRCAEHCEDFRKGFNRTIERVTIEEIRNSTCVGEKNIQWVQLGIQCSRRDMAQRTMQLMGCQ